MFFLMFCTRKDIFHFKSCIFHENYTLIWVEKKTQISSNYELLFFARISSKNSQKKSLLSTLHFIIISSSLQRPLPSHQFVRVKWRKQKGEHDKRKKNEIKINYSWFFFWWSGADHFHLKKNISFVSKNKNVCLSKE